ncbi:MAG: hypothetical protein II709_01495 [Ruminococcus sp.]|nr:hypothetical protein [Ruminococcus sp.]
MTFVMLGECVSQPKLPSYDIRAILLNCRHVRYIAYAVAVRVVNINDAVPVDVAYPRILSGCCRGKTKAVHH